MSKWRQKERLKTTAVVSGAGPGGRALGWAGSQELQQAAAAWAHTWLRISRAKGLGGRACLCLHAVCVQPARRVHACARVGSSCMPPIRWLVSRSSTCAGAPCRRATTLAPAPAGAEWWCGPAPGSGLAGRRDLCFSVHPPITLLPHTHVRAPSLPPPLLLSPSPPCQSYPCSRPSTPLQALVVCLNIGVDPPDVIKISPCARLQCWVDPLSMQAPKALDTIGACAPGGRGQCVWCAAAPQGVCGDGCWDGWAGVLCFLGRACGRGCRARRPCSVVAQQPTPPYPRPATSGCLCAPAKPPGAPQS